MRNMNKVCGCPTSFNIVIGLYLIVLSIISWLQLWEITMPKWLVLINLILGLLIIILNSLNRAYEKAEHLSVEEADKLHANEGF